MSAAKILVVCGLAREAALARSDDIAVIESGGRREALEARLATFDPTGLSAVVSFGLAGALDPTLAAGDLVVPVGAVVGTLQQRHAEEAGGAGRLEARSKTPSGGAPPDNTESVRPVYPTSPKLMAAWAEGGLGIPVASRGSIAGVDAPVTNAPAKAAFRAATGAVAVDMESHVAAAYAARHGLPFGILRVISDGADRAIPPAALAAMREDGGIDVTAVLRSLARDPRQLPALIGVARDGARAFRTLGRVGGLLRRSLGLHLR